MASIDEGIKRALAIIISWCANKNGIRKKSQERLKSDLNWLFGISARKSKKMIKLVNSTQLGFTETIFAGAILRNLWQIYASIV